MPLRELWRARGRQEMRKLGLMHYMRVHCLPALKDRDYWSHDGPGYRKQPGPKNTNVEIARKSLGDD